MAFNKKAYRKKYYQEHKQQEKDYQKKYYWKNPEKCRKNSTEYRRINPEKVKEIKRNCNLKHKDRINSYNKIYYTKNKDNFNKEKKWGQFIHREYNITVEEYEALQKQQDNKCGICNKPFAGKRRHSIDHLHKTKIIRGLLCGKCNSALGLFKDHPKILLKAINWVKKEGILYDSKRTQ